MTGRHRADDDAGVAPAWRRLLDRLIRWGRDFEPARARAQLAGAVVALAAAGVTVPAGWLHGAGVAVVVAGYVLPVLTGELIRSGVYAPASVAAEVRDTGDLMPPATPPPPEQQSADVPLRITPEEAQRRGWPASPPSPPGYHPYG